MALNQQQRDERRHEKAAKWQEEDLRLKVRPGTKQALLELMQWAGIKEQGEAITLMAHHIHGLGRLGVIRLIGSLHRIEHCENVERISDLIRFKARPGTVVALTDLVQWTGAQDQSAAIWLMIHALHDAGVDRALPFLALPPRSKYVIPEHIAAKLNNAYKREALRICRDE